MMVTSDDTTTPETGATKPEEDYDWPLGSTILIYGEHGGKVRGAGHSHEAARFRRAQHTSHGGALEELRRVMRVGPSGSGIM